MAIMHWEKDQSVATLIMENGENRHNPQFVESLLGCLEEIEGDTAIKALLLTSSDAKNWSQGIDLQWISQKFMAPDQHDDIRRFMHGLNQVFKRLLLFPVPVIAAINGHTFGNGAILACACDFRLMRSDRGFFCFPEVNVNIPFLPGMLAIVHKAMPNYKLEELYLTGNRATAPELEQAHVIIKACADQQVLLEQSLAFARSFDKGRKIFAEIKRRKHRQIIEIIERDDPPYIEGLKLITT